MQLCIAQSHHGSTKRQKTKGIKACSGIPPLIARPVLYATPKNFAKNAEAKSLYCLYLPNISARQLLEKLVSEMSLVIDLLTSSLLCIPALELHTPDSLLLFRDLLQCYARRKPSVD